LTAGNINALCRRVKGGSYIFAPVINVWTGEALTMTDMTNEAKKKERKKVLAGLLLTAIVFAWFLIYLFSHMPEQ